MRVEEFRQVLEDRDEDTPFTIRTRGGRAYKVPHRSSVWLPEEYEELVCVAVRGKGIAVLDVAAIDSVDVEHDAAASR